MLKALLEITILVSAFLAPKGLAAQLLDQARRGALILFLCEAILIVREQAAKG